MSSLIFISSRLNQCVRTYPRLNAPFRTLSCLSLIRISIGSRFQFITICEWEGEGEGYTKQVADIQKVIQLELDSIGSVTLQINNID